MELNRPFFGAADDQIIYDIKTCTDANYDEVYLDAYPTHPVGLDDTNEEIYFTSRSPFEDAPSSPRSVASFDNYDDNDNNARYEGRGASTTPEPYLELVYPLDRKYVEYVNRLPSDNEDDYDIDVDDRELDSYHNERSYFSKEEKEDRRYHRYDDDYRTEGQRYYTSDDEQTIKDSLTSHCHSTHLAHTSSHHPTHDTSTRHSTLDSHMYTPNSNYESDYTTEEETMNHTDANDADYRYLDTITNNNLNMTTLAFDRIVQEGLRSFPSSLLRLSDNDTESVGYSSENSETSGDMERSRNRKNTRAYGNMHRSISDNNSRTLSNGRNATSRNLKRSGNRSDINASRNTRSSGEKTNVSLSRSIQRSNDNDNPVSSITQRSSGNPDISASRDPHTSNENTNISASRRVQRCNGKTVVPSSNEKEGTTCEVKISKDDNTRVSDDIQRSSVDSNNVNDSSKATITSQRSRDPRLNRDLNKDDAKPDDGSAHPETAAQKKDAIQHKGINATALFRFFLTQTRDWSFLLPSCQSKLR